MSGRDIRDHYASFAEAARREVVVHTLDGKPTLVTISIDRARAIPQLEAEINPGDRLPDRNARFARLIALGGLGASVIGEPSAEELAQRSNFFRGHE